MTATVPNAATPGSLNAMPHGRSTQPAPEGFLARLPVFGLGLLLLGGLLFSVLAVNVRTAKAIGMSIPESILSRADEIIR